MATPAPSQALATLHAGQEELDALFDELTDAELSQPATIGGGAWAAKDLMGHIAFWEELALATVDMWRQPAFGTRWETPTIGLVGRTDSCA
jgi:DinB family protein